MRFAIFAALIAAAVPNSSKAATPVWNCVQREIGRPLVIGAIWNGNDAAARRAAALRILSQKCHAPAAAIRAAIRANLPGIFKGEIVGVEALLTNPAGLEVFQQRLGIIANGMEILGIAWGGPTMIMGFTPPAQRPEMQKFLAPSKNSREATSRLARGAARLGIPRVGWEVFCAATLKKTLERGSALLL